MGLPNGLGREHLGLSAGLVEGGAKSACRAVKEIAESVFNPGNENPAAHRARKGKQGDTAGENLLLPLATSLMDREVGLLVESLLGTSKEGVFAASTEVEEGLAVIGDKGASAQSASAVWTSALKHLRNAEQSCRSSVRKSPNELESYLLSPSTRL